MRLTSGGAPDAAVVSEDMTSVLAPVTKAQVRIMLMWWKNSDDTIEAHLDAIDEAIRPAEMQANEDTDNDDN